MPAVTFYVPGLGFVSVWNPEQIINTTPQPHTNHNTPEDLRLDSDEYFQNLMLRYDAFRNSINPPQFSEEELRYFEFLRSSHRQAHGKQAHDQRQPEPKLATRLPLDGADCPICMEPLDDSAEDLNWCRHGCGKSWHQWCINKWANSSGGALEERIGVPCPLCREQVPGPFGDDVEPDGGDAESERESGAWWGDAREEERGDPLEYFVVPVDFDGFEYEDGYEYEVENEDEDEDFHDYDDSHEYEEEYEYGDEWGDESFDDSHDFEGVEGVAECADDLGVALRRMFGEEPESEDDGENGNAPLQLTEAFAPFLLGLIQQAFDQAHENF